MRPRKDIKIIGIPQVTKHYSMPVRFCSDKGKFVALFTYKKKNYYAGYHATEAAAKSALESKENEVAAELGIETVRKVLRPYKAEIIVAGKKRYIGAYATKEEARAAYETRKAEVEADKAERERQQELETPGHGPGKIPMRDNEGAIVDWAIVDIEDEARVRMHRWHLERTSTNVQYAGSSSTNNLRLHAFIMGQALDDKVIDHIDGNGLNNKRSNLRIASRPINSFNVKPPKNNTGYIGVRKNKNRFHCRIKNLFDISFGSAIEAATEYDRIVLKLYGPHATTNNTLSEEESSKIITQFNESGPEFFKVIREGDSFRTNESDAVFPTFEEAFQSLQKAIVKRQVDNYRLKLEMSPIDPQQQILRDNAGNAVIELRDKNKNVIAYALVDDEIWHEATRHNWYLGTDQYVSSDMTDLGRIRLHNFVWRKLKGEIEKGMLVDHIICGKGNRRNCKLANLRINTPSGNSHNRRSITGKKGVQLAKNGKFKAYVKLNGERTYIGTFETEEMAARAVDRRHVELYGEMASLNYPVPIDS